MNFFEKIFRPPMKPFVSAKKKSRKQKSPAVKAGLFWMEQMMGIEPESGLLSGKTVAYKAALQAGSYEVERTLRDFIHREKRNSVLHDVLCLTTQK